MSVFLHLLRQPLTSVIAILAVTIAGSTLACAQTKSDTVPKHKLPVIYVAQPFKGMDAVEMKSLVANYYAYHFMYIKGTRKVETTYQREGAVVRVYFEPGTDMAKVMAETIEYIDRSRAFMPSGVAPATALRFEMVDIPLLNMSVPLPIGKSVPRN